jgi:hypothetical protein
MHKGADATPPRNTLYQRESFVKPLTDAVEALLKSEFIATRTFGAVSKAAKTLTGWTQKTPFNRLRVLAADHPAHHKRTSTFFDQNALPFNHHKNRWQTIPSMSSLQKGGTVR